MRDASSSNIKAEQSMEDSASTHVIPSIGKWLYMPTLSISPENLVQETHLVWETHLNIHCMLDHLRRVRAHAHTWGNVRAWDEKGSAPMRS